MPLSRPYTVYDFKPKAQVESLEEIGVIGLRLVVLLPQVCSLPGIWVAAIVEVVEIGVLVIVLRSIVFVRFFVVRLLSWAIKDVVYPKVAVRKKVGNATVLDIPVIKKQKVAIVSEVENIPLLVKIG